MGNSSKIQKIKQPKDLYFCGLNASETSWIDSFNRPLRVILGPIMAAI